MNWSGLTATWSGPKIKRTRALLVKEWLVYADQKFFVLAGLAFQLFLVGTFFFLARFPLAGPAGWPGFNLSGPGAYSFLVILVLMIFSSVSGFLPGRLLQEMDNKNLAACLLTPASFFEWVLAAAIFGFLVNIIYLFLLVAAGAWFFRISASGGLVLAGILTLVILLVWALGFILAALTLIFRQGYVFYTLLETGIILGLAFLLPGGGLHGWPALLKFSPQYLVFQGLRLGFGGPGPEILKYIVYLALAAALAWPSGIFLLNRAYNSARQKAVF